MLNLKVYKPLENFDEYNKLAKFVSENAGYIIQDFGDYYAIEEFSNFDDCYEVEELPNPTQEELPNS